MDWSRISRETIAKVHASLPADISYKDRVIALQAAYPFGERERWPYKAWCKAQREYLRRFDPNAPASPPLSTREKIAAGRPDIYFPFAKDQQR